MTVTIAISMGDPAGIGPEVIIKALHQIEDSGLSFMVFGERAGFQRTAEILGCSLPAGSVEWVEVGRGDTAGPCGSHGRLQVQSLKLAADAVASGRADALCTAPITKAAARSAGFPFAGHTEYLAQRFQTARYAPTGIGVGVGVRVGVRAGVAMMLAGPTLRVVPITRHLPLREVAARISPEAVARTLATTACALVELFGIPCPRVALAALNPHAGEAGMLGREEELVLGPGLERAAQELADAGLQARLQGPIPADSVFIEPAAFDAVVCCYHDQALIPLKMLHRDEAVNITLGLPIVRTSPAHGSAPDIAGRGVANPRSMLAALRLAAQLVRRSRDRDQLPG